MNQNSVSKIYGFSRAVKLNPGGCGQVREAMDVPEGVEQGKIIVLFS